MYLKKKLSSFISCCRIIPFYTIAAVAQWIRLEFRCERSHVRSQLCMSFRFGRNLALHHTNVLALC